MAQMPSHLLVYISAQLNELGNTIDPCNLRDTVVREVAYAYAPPVHEQRRFSYGSIIASSQPGLLELLKGNFDVVAEDIDSGLGRTLADGKSTFLAIVAGRTHLWRTRKGPLVSEVDLFFLRDQVMFKLPGESPTKVTDRELTIVQRDERGSLTLLNWNGVFQCRHGHWSRRKYQYEYKVEDHLQRFFGDEDKDRTQIVRSILKIAAHILSPVGIGATLVMKTATTYNFASKLKVSNVISPPAMCVLSPAIHSTFAHIAAQKDGAIVVDCSGNVECVGAMLNPGSTWIKKIKVSLGGSRQLSAQAFSLAVDKQALIVTVSADGPVRAFFQGNLI